MKRGPAGFKRGREGEGTMKALPLAVALLALALPLPAASAVPCVIVDPDGFPPAYVGECYGTQAAPGKLVIFGTGDTCVAIEPSAFPQVVNVYECDAGGLINP